MLNARLEYVESNPDFVIRVESDTEERSKRISEKFPYFVFGRAFITFSDISNDEEFFSTQVSNIKGGDFDSREIAGLRSYDEMIKEMIDVVGIANQNNKLVESYQVEVDKIYK